MKKRFKIPIIITIIALVLSCFTIPAFATPSHVNFSGDVYEPIFYPRYTLYYMEEADNLGYGFDILYDTHEYNNIGVNYVSSTGTRLDYSGNYILPTLDVHSMLGYIDEMQSYMYLASNYPYVIDDEFAPMNITYYFDDIGVRGDLYDNVVNQNLYHFMTSFEDQDRNNLLQDFTVYFNYKSYDYALDDFKITNYQQRFNPISNDFTSLLSAFYGVDSNMLYVNPLELVKQLANDDGLSLFGILTDIRIEVNLSYSVQPTITSVSMANDQGFNAENTISDIEDLYMQYGEDNAASAEVPTDLFGWVVDCASSLFEFELMPGLSISIIFVGILGILVFIYIMKRFAGG